MARLSTEAEAEEPAAEAAGRGDAASAVIMKSAASHPAQPAIDAAAEQAVVVFYDGHCGLCHRWVQFVLPRDRHDRFVFAPLQGDAIHSLLPREQIEQLPDSIVVREPDGTVRVKSDAVLAILSGLGGFWGGLARLGRCVPRGVRDFFYDRVAAVRHRFFAKPEEACPLMPPELRHKFRM